ncbi:MAG: hypothetical protein IJS08_02945, partial [Victivallales bacterium]|nr:hypothetical protein [Victivallales bacterium]
LAIVLIGGYLIKRGIKSSSLIHRKSRDKDSMIASSPPSQQADNAQTPSSPKASSRVPQAEPAKQTWVHPKDWYETQCREIQHNRKTLCSGGYLFDPNEATAISNQIKTLQNSILKNKALDCNVSFDKLLRQYRAFSASCKWQQGLRHTEFPHIVSSFQRGKWEVEEGYEFVNPGTSDLTVKEKKHQLTHSPNWYVRECDEICKNVEKIQKGPYSYDSQLAEKVLSNATQLIAKAYLEKPKVVDGMYADLQESYNRFKTTCRWCSGVRHPTLAHVISSVRENTWTAETGWVFIHPGTSDLSVKKVIVMQTCDKCQGIGRITAKSRCFQCNGNGRIRNPASEIGQAVKDVAGVFSGRSAGRPPNVPTGPAYIPCVGCGGRGFIQMEVTCNNCRGLGKTFK